MVTDVSPRENAGKPGKPGELAGMAYINASFGISCRQRQTAEVPCQHKGGKTLQLCLQNLSCNNIGRGKRFTINDISITAKFVVSIHL